MSVSARQNPLQSYQLIVYGRALHPSHFQLRGRRVIDHNGYVFEAWVMAGQHALRFERAGGCCTEHVTDQDRSIPTGSIVAQHLCASEKECEHVFKDGVRYMSNCQTETLSEALYAGEYDSMIELARQEQGLVHLWEDEVGRCMSLINAQRYADYVSVQCYHLIADAGLVLKTQSTFDVHAGGGGGGGVVEVKPNAAARKNGR
jgi:hypothetical protein